jgi:hypothetical protein
VCRLDAGFPQRVAVEAQTVMRWPPKDPPSRRNASVFWSITATL